jgi:hypothetical protein
MRALITTRSGFGHSHPLVPLAQALPGPNAGLSPSGSLKLSSYVLVSAGGDNVHFT